MIEFTQTGLNLTLDTDELVQFSRDTPVQVTLKDDTFAAADDLSLNFVPEDGRKHAPARVELTKSDADGVYTGVIGKAAALVSGITSVALGGIVTSTGQVITSRTERVMIDRSVDPEAVPVPDSESLAVFIRTAIDGYAGEHGITTGATAEQAAQIEQNAAAVTDLKSDLAKLDDYVQVAEEDEKDAVYVTDASGNVICKIDKDGVHSVGFDGKNLALNDVLSTYDDAFYITDADGNVIFKADKEGIVGLNMGGSSAKSPYKDKILLSIGDSLSAHDKWQKWLVEWWGCTFDTDKNVNGDGDYPPMAKGGTAVFPNSKDSIYIRALSASHYNPDIIVVYAGQNDVPHFGSDTEINSSAVGTIDDTPYKKTVPYTELEESEYADYTSWYEGRPTLYSYCMGMIENLLTSCPTAKIIVITPMQMWTDDGTQSVGRKQLVAAWNEICNKYGLPIVDLWNESGVNAFNMAEYYPNVGNVHPNDYGYKRIAETIYSKM